MTALSELIADKHDALRDHLGAAGFDAGLPYSAALPKTAAVKLAEYIELLAKWTGRVDLVAPAPVEVLVERHIVDCLAAGLVLASVDSESSGSCIDVGSGAGLPGLIWAILELDRRILLCEPRQKRVVFLREAVRRLELPHVEIVQERVENVSRETFSGFSLATARALGSDGQFLASASPLLGPNGRIALLVGPNWEAPADLPSDMQFQQLIPYSLGSTGPQRQLALWQKCFT